MSFMQSTNTNFIDTIVKMLVQFYKEPFQRSNQTNFDRRRSINHSEMDIFKPFFEILNSTMQHT